jgi:hypothetical protein
MRALISARLLNPPSVKKSTRVGIESPARSDAMISFMIGNSSL